MILQELWFYCSKKTSRGIYNVGSEKEYQNIEIAKMICKLFGKDPKKFIEFVRDRPYNDMRYSVSTKKICSLGWKPKDKLMDDLPKIIEWYKKIIKFSKLDEKKI